MSALMIEIRRDVYMAEPGGAPGPGVVTLAAALARLVDLLPDLLPDRLTDV